MALSRRERPLRCRCAHQPQLRRNHAVRTRRDAQGDRRARRERLHAQHLAVVIGQHESGMDPYRRVARIGGRWLQEQGQGVLPDAGDDSEPRRGGDGPGYLFSAGTWSFLGRNHGRHTFQGGYSERQALHYVAELCGYSERRALPYVAEPFCPLSYSVMITGMLWANAVLNRRLRQAAGLHPICPRRSYLVAIISIVSFSSRVRAADIDAGRARMTRRAGRGESARLSARPAGVVHANEG